MHTATSATTAPPAHPEDGSSDAEEWLDADMGGAATSRSAEGSDGEDAAFYDADRQLDGDMTAEYPAHAAAFYDDVERLQQLLEGMTDEQREAHDSQGNTVLHIAALRQHVATVRFLIGFGFPVMKQNSRGWIALDEAVSLKNSELVQTAAIAAHVQLAHVSPNAKQLQAYISDRLLLHVQAEILYFGMVDQMKATVKGKRKGLLTSMRDMPDHNLSLQWELGSPVLGFLLRKYAPHDTYQVWKRGLRVRVDGSLMGVDKESAGMLPQWKRGTFSLLFDGSQQPARVLLLDRDKHTYMDMQKERKAAKRDRKAEVHGLMSEGPGKTKMRMSDFHFKPVKTLLGRPSTEKIGGWRTQVYQATGKLVAVTTAKATMVVPQDATFEDYLQLSMAEDRSVSIPIDPLSMNGMNAGKDGLGALDKDATEEEIEAAAAAAEAVAQKKGGRKITARCWMAQGFPLSLQQLLPIMDVIGYANKYLKRVGKFMQKYGQLNLFPVKLQVPIIFTVYLVLINKSFRLLRPDEEAARDDFYELPSDYELKDMKQTGIMSFEEDEDPFAF